MATVYKTPGVYIEEISKFPPSIAQVETAIPAFIGYTETATRDGEDLTNVPTRILSLLEYQTYFGGAQEEENLVVTIDDTTDGATPIFVTTLEDIPNKNFTLEVGGTISGRVTMDHGTTPVADIRAMLSRLAIRRSP